jgi:hypothetical protein
MNKDSSTLFVFPDPLWTPDMISGSAFLYFKGPILFTIPSASSIGLLGAGPWKLRKMVQDRQPTWSDPFLKMFNLYVVGTQASSETMKILSPLHGEGFKWIQLVFPHTKEWLAEAGELINSSGLDRNAVTDMIHPLSAGDGLAKHVLFEMYIQTIHSGKNDSEIFALGQEYARRSMSGDPNPSEYEADPSLLYDYCENLFSQEPFDLLLCKAYMLRLLALRKMGDANLIFLSNPKLISFLISLPTGISENTSQTYESNADVVAWEIFRQLLSPVIDPLTSERVELVAKFRKERSDEVARLRSKCQKLANELRSFPRLESLEQEIVNLVDNEVRRELADLIQLDKRSLEEFLVSVFSDEKTWLALSVFIASFFAGQDLVKAGSAIATLSNLGAKAFKAAADRRKVLRSSDYALIYNLGRAVVKK